MNPEIFKSLKHNFTVNILDGAFFGFAVGFASYVTILPLFVSTMTSSPLLLGLVSAVHNVGWQLPQLLTANKVARQKKHKSLVLRMTIHERLPFLGLAIIALLLPKIGTRLGLFLTFAMFAWQSFGGGFAATAWQSMVARIFPPDRRGTFFGLQSSASNAMASVSAIAAGFILEKFNSHLDFAICFFFTCAGMVISWLFLARTREPERSVDELPPDQPPVWAKSKEILKTDKNFGRFLLARILSQLAMMGFAFYSVYAVGTHHVSESQIGIMTGLLLGVQIIANPIMGWAGDRWSNHTVMRFGMLAATLSALLAWWAPSAEFFYLVYMLTGIANVSVWTTGLAIIHEFGKESERPVYIGMANTLVSPANLLSPFLGGFLASISGYQAAFFASAIAGLAAVLVYQFLVKDPRSSKTGQVIEEAPV